MVQLYRDIVDTSNNQIVEEKPTDAIDELLMKLFPIYEKKNKLVISALCRLLFKKESIGLFC